MLLPYMDGQVAHTATYLAHDLVESPIWEHL